MLFSCSLGYWEDLANQSVENMVKQLRLQQSQPDISCDVGDLRGLKLANPLVGCWQAQQKAGQPAVQQSRAVLGGIFVLCSGAKVVLSFLSKFVLLQVAGISTVHVGQRAQVTDAER